MKSVSGSEAWPGSMCQRLVTGRGTGPEGLSGSNWGFRSLPPGVSGVGASAHFLPPSFDRWIIGPQKPLFMAA